jgi:hypothetical protein
MKKQLGFLIVLTSAFLSGVPLPASAGNIYDIATTCIWKFGRTDGHPCQLKGMGSQIC